MSEKKYTPKATVTKISAVSRVAVKIRDNFYTVEYSEERSIVEDANTDMEQERKCLFDDVNAIVDSQVEDIISTFQKK